MGNSYSIPKFFSSICLGCFSISGAAIASEPEAKNDLPIRPNPTAEVTSVCYSLSEKNYSQLVHATCYSEINQAVVVLVSGKPKGMEGQAVAKHIVNEFGKAHVPAAAYMRFPELDGVGVTYVLNGDPYGPYSGKNWREGFEIVIRHAPEAWFKN